MLGGADFVISVKAKLKNSRLFSGAELEKKLNKNKNSKLPVTTQMQ